MLHFTPVFLTMIMIIMAQISSKQTFSILNAFTAAHIAISLKPLLLKVFSMYQKSYTTVARRIARVTNQFQASGNLCRVSYTKINYLSNWVVPHTIGHWHSHDLNIKCYATIKNSIR